VQAVPHLCEFYPGICLTTEEKAQKNLSQGKKNLSKGKKNLSQGTVIEALISKRVFLTNFGALYLLLQ